MWCFLLGVAVILYIIHYYFSNAENAKLFAKVPGPKPLPIIGNLIDFVLDQVQLFYYLRSLANKYKSIYGIQICGNRILNIFNPSDIEIILSSQKYITKSVIYTLLHPWLNEGLLTSNGEKWRNRRKILTPAFHVNVLRQYCNIFSKQSIKTVEMMKSEVGKEETNILPYATQYTINSVCETAMGVNLEENINSDHKKYKQAIYDILNFFIYRLLRLWLYADTIFQMSPIGKKQKGTLTILHKFTSDVANQRRKNMLTENTMVAVKEIENDDYIKSSKKRLAFLDLLLSAESEGKINEQGVREEVDTFLFEGHDTTTMAVTFCLMLLANHESIQERVMEELDEIFEDSTQPATMEDINKMVYLEMCLKESLRLYPSVTFISRAIEENIQMTDYLIPAGTICFIHIFDLHRDSNIYPDPDEFIPERFTQENCAQRHPFAYIPFSAGPRNCIGLKFALNQAKAVISTTLRNFRLEAVTRPQDIVFSTDLVLRSRDPIKIKFLPRNA